MNSTKSLTPRGEGPFSLFKLKSYRKQLFYILETHIKHLTHALEKHSFQITLEEVNTRSATKDPELRCEV